LHSGQSEVDSLGSVPHFSICLGLSKGRGYIDLTEMTCVAKSTGIGLALALKWIIPLGLESHSYRGRLCHSVSTN
jgi:hypothetical protein